MHAGFLREINMISVQHKIAIVDDHDLVRDGLTLRLSMHPRFVVCGEAKCEESAYELIKEKIPDLAIIDIGLGEGHGIELIKRIKRDFPSVKMLVLSGMDSELYADRAIRAGAGGYVNKSQASGDLVTALDTVLREEVYMGGNILKEFDAASKASRSKTEVDSLSDRELQVFELIGRGLPSREIARRLHLSPHTVDTHRENIKKKLRLPTAAELTRAAVQWQLESNVG